MKPSLLPLSPSISPPSLALSVKLDQKVSVALSKPSLPSPQPRLQLHPMWLTDTDVVDASSLGGEIPTGLSASSCFRTVSMQLSPESVRGKQERGGEWGRRGLQGSFLQKVCVCVWMWRRWCQVTPAEADPACLCVPH